MKKITTSVVLSILSLLLTAPLNASVVITLTAGQLLLADGSTPIADGSLIQIVANTNSSAFTDPTPGSFTGGSSNDVVVASFAMDSSTVGIPGDFQKDVTLTLGGSFAAGNQLLLRWFPTLTLASSVPGAGAPFGQFRTNAIVDGSTIAWITPSDGAHPNLNFLTVSQGGSQPNTTGKASNATTAVPEPSTVALLAISTAGLALWRRRRS